MEPLSDEWPGRSAATRRLPDAVVALGAALAPLTSLAFVDRALRPQDPLLALLGASVALACLSQRQTRRHPTHDALRTTDFARGVALLIAAVGVFASAVSWVTCLLAMIPLALAVWRLHALVRVDHLQAAWLDRVQQGTEAPWHVGPLVPQTSGALPFAQSDRSVGRTRSLPEALVQTRVDPHFRGTSFGPPLALFPWGVEATRRALRRRCAVASFALLATGMSLGAQTLRRLSLHQGTDRETPDLHYPDTAVVSLVAGGDSTCATARDGFVWCFGSQSPRLHDPPVVDDHDDVLGRLTESIAPSEAVERVIPWWIQRSSCLLSDGVLRCSERLPGLLPLEEQPGRLPIWAREISRATLDYTSVCILYRTGRVRCHDHDAPGGLRDIALPGAAADLVAGHAYVCARLTDGSVYCWGSNLHGAIDTSPGAPRDVPQPRRIAGIYDAAELALGLSFGCVRSNDGAVRCWGRLSSSAATASPTIPVLTGAIQIAAQTYRACAVRPGGELFCWGELHPTPERVQGVRHVEQVALTGNLLCARQTDGTLRCQRAPSAVMRLTPMRGVTEITGGDALCARQSSGATTCWRDAGQEVAHRERPQRLGAVVAPSEIALGPWAGCARDVAGSVRCWHRDAWDPATTVSAEEVRGLPRSVSIAVGGQQACAVGADGLVRCWSDASVPAEGSTRVVERVRDAVQVCAGDQHACALTREGHVWCWGDNAERQIGAADEDARGPIEVLAEASELGCGAFHTCARMRSGEVRCWGRAEENELGAPRALGREVPQTVPGVTGAVSLVGGGFNACARQASGVTRCWGNVGYRGISPDAAVHSTTIPTTARLTLGAAHGCLLNEGQLWCLGWNNRGQLGALPTVTFDVPCRPSPCSEQQTMVVGMTSTFIPVRW